MTAERSDWTSNVVLVSYDPRWPAIFEAVASELREACGDALLSVEHIGSTAIPGCEAKPVIDVMPGLASFEAGLRCVAPLEALGYEYRGEYGIARRHYFARPPRSGRDELRLHVHMYAPGEGQWAAQLAFRDYLRSHVEAREQYVALKRVLAERFPHDGNAYADAKSEFVAEILSRAGLGR